MNVRGDRGFGLWYLTCCFVDSGLGWVFENTPRFDGETAGPGDATEKPGLPCEARSHRLPKIVAVNSGSVPPWKAVPALANASYVSSRLRR